MKLTLLLSGGLNKSSSTLSLSCRQEACSNLKINCDLTVSRPPWAGSYTTPQAGKGSLSTAALQKADEIGAHSVQRDRFCRPALRWNGAESKRGAGEASDNMLSGAQIEGARVWHGCVE